MTRRQGIEYVLLVALIAVVCVVAVLALHPDAVAALVDGDAAVDADSDLSHD
jgi:hypothetical protein